MRVNLEPSVWTDARFMLLAQLMGWSSADTAIGAMARVWRQCTIQETYALADETVDLLLGKGGAIAVIRSGLGERIACELPPNSLPNGSPIPSSGGALPAIASTIHSELPANTPPIPCGLIRIKGTAGRIEWNKNLRENGKKGGRPKADATSPGEAAHPGKPTGKPNGLVAENPLALAPALAPALVTEREAANAAGAAPPPSVAARSKPRAHQLPADWAPTPQHLAYAQQHGLQVEHEAGKFRLHAEAHHRLAVRWNAAFAQWLMRATEYRAISPHPNRQPEQPVRRFRDI